MEKGTVTGVLWRRKAWTLVALLLTVAAAVFSFNSHSPTYSYSSSVLLVPPKRDLTPTEQRYDTARGNVLFYLDALGETRDLLIATMTSRAMTDKIAKEHPGAGFTVERNYTISAPVLDITTTAADAASASRLLTDLTDIVPSVLVQLQDGVGVPKAGLITAHVISKDDTPVISSKARLRSGITAAGLVGLMSFFLIAVVDGLLNARARRRGTPSKRPETTDDDEAPGRDVAADDGLVNGSALPARS